MRKTKNKKPTINEAIKFARLEYFLREIGKIPFLLQHLRYELHLKLNKEEKELMLDAERRIERSLRGWKSIVKLNVYELKGLMNRKKPYLK